MTVITESKQTRVLGLIGSTLQIVRKALLYPPDSPRVRSVTVVTYPPAWCQNTDRRVCKKFRVLKPKKTCTVYTIPWERGVRHYFLIAARAYGVTLLS